MSGALFQVGSLLLFVAFVLYIIVSASAPAWHTMGFLTVNYVDPSSSSSAQLHFGTFGYCLRDEAGTVCSRSHVGYDIVTLISAAGGQPFSSSTTTTLNNIIRALVLHAIAAAITGVAFTVSLGAKRIGFIFASLIATVAWVLGLLAIILDFVAFSIVRRHVDVPGMNSQYSTAIWLAVVAFLLAFLGSIILAFGRIEERRKQTIIVVN